MMVLPMPEKERLAPIVKWAGGKRQLLSIIEKNLPQSFNRYYEPFVGGGALLFHLQPEKAVINDVNEELINLYRVVKDDVDALIETLKQFRNEATYFYAIRAQDREKGFQEKTRVERAARIHYLNKTCYNGLYRVNSRGQFNAPFGRYKNPNIVNEKNLRALHLYLNNGRVDILNMDFADALESADKDAFVYLDPPYDPLSESAHFTGYAKNGFGRAEQIRLKETCDDLHKRGARFLLSNSATDFIKDLYKTYEIRIVRAKRAVNSKGDKRGAVDEVLVKNY